MTIDLYEFLQTFNLFILNVEVLECIIIYDEVFLLLFLFNIFEVDLHIFTHQCT
jgi:hypothetical protein